MSRPVSRNSTVLRNPPTVLRQTFVLDGGGSPTTPAIATRSAPSWLTAIVSSRVETSGPR
jgi:hypothetical protein